MEGVGARLGRSSTRYGPATVFTGPVRKWKKKWVHVSPSSASSNSNTNHNHNHTHSSNASHLLLYKWTPITQSHNTTTNNSNTATANGNTKDAQPEQLEEPPRRKFKYVPVALLEEQRNEAAENEGAEKLDESKPTDTDSGAAESARKSETLDEKPDINDVPMEESQSQYKNQVVRQDLNESTLDLSLGLTSHEDEHDSDSKPNQTRDGQQR
ncbi:uncharacterized protein LOC124832984 [Vigna umbellata]|uniref:Uncharacterized protein n=2 Tax=Phaseolus angularis TaxID=3914 RepID=A0A0L9VE20_PHAAN|nr:uncharacterized protein LOC108341185 [Vigna angularis]XP_047163295.1 uncharacterized protein LOC124832984 [Vigna umbellata]KOM53306.1 hypothetical protein LR48_Vigan09g196500 [Vigna angularis]BAT87524.1 hypothetical protein VIGAN_05090600 [Vigna angularis var. angularis]